VYDDEEPAGVLLAKAAKLLVSADIPDGLEGFRLNTNRNLEVMLSANGQPAVGRLDFEFLENSDHYFSAELFGDAAFASSTGRTHRVSIREVRGTGHHHAHDGDILSPMPGRIIAVEVTQGQAVTKGQKLLTLEAMKMEHTLTAPFDGVVAELNAETGAQVQVEALLVRIEAEE
jgi:3-methylcrotonyl-CoA carboxylase alpha subunit